MVRLALIALKLICIPLTCMVITDSALLGNHTRPKHIAFNHIAIVLLIMHITKNGDIAIVGNWSEANSCSELFY